VVLNDEESAAVVVRHLEQLSSQWLGVLQEPAYSRLTGFLFECVVRDCMAPVLAAECISESAATDISRLYRTIARAKYVIFSFILAVSVKLYSVHALSTFRASDIYFFYI